MGKREKGMAEREKERDLPVYLLFSHLDSPLDWETKTDALGLVNTIQNSLLRRP